MIECYFDGACGPVNPGGKMGMGAKIFVGGAEIKSICLGSSAHPDNTNNVAEYLAFESLLDWLDENEKHDEKVYVYGDSMLVVKQMNGLWRIKVGSYVPHADRCKIKASKFNDMEVCWIPREKNEHVDELSKNGLKL